MDYLTIDMETYYAQDYSLSKMTTEAYIRDPRFETILVGLQWGDDKPFWLLPDRFAAFAQDEVDWAQTAVVMHHAHFDAAILAWRYGIRPGFIVDTLSMARVVDGPKAGNSLAELCVRHGIGTKGDYVTFAKGKHLADFARDELHAYAQYCCNDVAKTWLLAKKFLPHFPTAELRLIDMTVRMFTEPVFEGDTATLSDAVAAEQERKAGLLDALGLDKSVFASNDKFAEVLRVVGIEPPMKRSNTTGDMIPAFAKTDPGMQALLEHEDELVQALAAARLATRSTIIETRTQRLLDCAKRGPMPVYLKYGGAHTWRWSGGDGMNWQNMFTHARAGRPETTAIARAIRAPTGSLIVRADSAQIEARVIAWLAGHDDKVAAFAQGRDVYSEFASQVYGRPVDRKRNKDDFIPGQLGKVSELGLGFGMGWTKFAAELLKGMLGAPPIQFKHADLAALHVNPTAFLSDSRKVDQVDKMPSRLELSDRLVHCAVAEAVVNRWRQANPQVVGLWRVMDDVIRAMMRGQSLAFGPGGLLVVEGESIRLPSGLHLRYRDLQETEGEFTYWNGKKRVKLYGALLTENVVQALARIVVSEQMVRVYDELSLRPATMTHDEVVYVAPEDVAQQLLEYVLHVMQTPPAWAKGLPLAAEGGWGSTYMEAK